ncbi:MAG: DUF3630 family protein [Chitinophagaceae bacterium]
MQPDQISKNGNIIIDENGSLAQFYSLTNILSKSRHVRYISKNDEADNIEWNFKYRGHPLTLQYNIYNGVCLYARENKDAKAVTDLMEKLRRKNKAIQ